MRNAIVLTLTLCFNTVNADDLDVIVSKGSSAEARGEAYTRLTSVEFSTIAAKLLTLIGTHPVFIAPSQLTKQPWSDPQLTEDNQVACTLSQLWSYHTEHGRYFELMLTLLEDPSVGHGRYLALAELSSYIPFGETPSAPAPSTIDDALVRLDHFAFNPKQPNSLRRKTIKILFQHGDPNKYVDLAIELSSAENSILRRSDAFCDCTPTYQASKLSDENRKKYLRHCYRMLEELDDGKTGNGYHLALHIGHFLGISPVRPGKSPFAPDQGLPQYQGPTSLTESFFQDTVNNARKWWDDNKAHYCANAEPAAAPVRDGE